MAVSALGRGHTGEVNCILTKGLIPYVERHVGADGITPLLQATGRSREYLMAEYNWLPLSLVDQFVRLTMERMGESDPDQWGRRFADDFMDWKPSREERGWAGAYTLSLGSPRAVYADTLNMLLHQGWARFEIVSMGRRHASYRLTPNQGVPVPRWLCTWIRVVYERFPTNWGVPRARITEHRCAARGDDHCQWEVRWKNPSFGARFWAPAAAGIAASGALGALLATTAALPWPATAGLVALPALCGGALGYALLQHHRRGHFQGLLKVQGDEILYSSLELEKKFRDLATKVEQLSLLSDLGAAVNATLDPERIYQQALGQLVHRMGYQGAHLYLVDRERQRIVGHTGTGSSSAIEFEKIDLSLDPTKSVVAKVAVTGTPVLVEDIETTTEPADRALARALNVRSGVAVPLRVRGRVFGVIQAVSSRPHALAAGDIELLTAVANHVAMAVDRADSFQTIEDLSRGLEEKVRVRTEQLRAANEELQAAYRDLQATQMQLIHREKMASVGQLVAGVAHELNNPIGFVFSNVSTLDDFVKRLRAMLDAYRTVPLPDAEAERMQRHWAELKVDYALKYLDSMTQGIREGAERARKIVRDLRVFARSQDDVWQAVDLHEDLESSLTLLNHLLKDRITIHRKFGDVPPVECVRSQIDQVFLNLLANAAQAISDQGAITIETRRENGNAVVAISDTGPGIAPEIIGRIFDPFYTTKPVGEGTGLGLSISYEIVKKHGGHIRAENAPGGGATFTVSVPLSRSR
jgi:signal transduction histidine kinase